MKDFKADFIKIYHNERGIILFIIINLILSLALLVFSIIHLNPNAAIVKTGYGDIGGYRDGTWTDLLTFPLLAIIFGIFHALLSLKIFHKRGGGMTKFFLITTTALILGSFLVLTRLLGDA